MLGFLWSRKPVPSDRKVRLCMIAWCCHVKGTFFYFHDAVFSLHSLEQLADGVISRKQYLSFDERYIGRWAPDKAVLAATTAEEPVPLENVLRVCSAAVQLSATVEDAVPEWTDDQGHAFLTIQQGWIQADMLRHIIGNPF